MPTVEILVGAEGAARDKTGGGFADDFIDE
jgi:hypothetical protein